MGGEGISGICYHFDVWFSRHSSLLTQRSSGSRLVFVSHQRVERRDVVGGLDMVLPRTSKCSRHLQWWRHTEMVETETEGGHVIEVRIGTRVTVHSTTIQFCP